MTKGGSRGDDAGVMTPPRDDAGVTTKPPRVKTIGVAGAKEWRDGVTTMAHEEEEEEVTTGEEEVVEGEGESLWGATGVTGSSVGFSVFSVGEWVELGDFTRIS